MNFIKMVLAVLVAQVFVVMLGITTLVFIGVAVKLSGGTHVEKGSYLVIDVYGQIFPYDPPETLSSELFGDSPETVHRMLTNLEKAAVDERVEGVILKISRSNSLGRASIEELRGAIERVKAEGKPVIAYSDGLDRRSLMLASACDSIFMPEVSDLHFFGMGMTASFFKGTLDKLGIRPNIHRIAEYKSAAEPALREDLSPEAREMYGWMLDEFWDIELGAISEGRGIAREELERHMEHMLFTAPEALEAGLIDGLAFWNDIEDRLKEEADDDLRTVGQSDYEEVSRADVDLKGDRRIAVVHAHGMIGGRSSRVDPWLGVVMGHQTVIAALSSAGDDDDIDAVVFRVDSNGGESLAGEIIAHEVARIAEKKPVVVSMLDVAASAGYTISYKATRVVADPSTVTGSIGSIYGKMNTAGMYNKLGMTFDSITKGPNALFWSPVTDFSDDQWERFTDHHYDSFNMWLEDISETRGIPLDTLETLAMGRVWTGRQARANGLVDELGGLDRAIEIAKIEAGIPAEQEITRIDYPRKRGLLSLLTSSRGPFALANWMVYKMIHHDLAETVRLVTHSELGFDISR